MCITKVLFMSRLVLLLLIFLNSTAALAQDPVLRRSQYPHTSWPLQDGVFNGVPTAIVQTADGYLWIGTSSGLLRFAMLGTLFDALLGLPIKPFRPRKPVSRSSSTPLEAPSRGIVQVEAVHVDVNDCHFEPQISTGPAGRRAQSLGSCLSKQARSLRG